MTEGEVERLRADAMGYIREVCREEVSKAMPEALVVAWLKIARLRLTDEELESVRFFSQIDGPGNVPVANRRAATLRGLLERLS